LEFFPFVLLLHAFTCPSWLPISSPCANGRSRPSLSDRKDQVVQAEAVPQMAIWQSP
jgi:hypothetical protein